LFDLKHPDDQRHEKSTGVSNRSILDNFKAIHARVGSSRIIPRIPLIPGMTMDRADIEKTVAFLSENCKYKGAVHLMPYNKLCRTKYEKIGRVEDYLDFGSIGEEELQEIVRCIESFSLKAVINR
jgi:pyruvate formate lyase activating enzyme